MGGQAFPAVYVPTDNDTVDDKGRLLDAQQAQAQAHADAVTGAQAIIKEAATETKTLHAPLPYNLLKLQTEAARLHRFKPDYVKSITQTLREKHRLITYNRSDCQYLPEDQHADAPGVLAAIVSTCPDLAGIAGNADPVIKGRAFDSGKITAHHAIVPTASTANIEHLSRDERVIYTMIAQAYIAQFYPPYEYEQTNIRVTVNGREFLCRTHVALSPGWKVLFQHESEEKEDESETDSEVAQSLKNLRCGQEGLCVSAAVARGETKPRPLYTMATLLADLTRVAQYVRDERLRKLLIEKDRDKAGEHGGIGTPATRDAIIATLFERGFLVEQRQGKALHVISTGAGREFYDTLPDQARFPDMTALWHEQQLEIERGQREIGAFVRELVDYITEETARVKREGLNLKATFHPCPACGKALLPRSGAKGAFWGCSGYPDCRKTLPDQDGKPGADSLPKSPTSELHQCLDCGKGLIRRKSKNGTDYWWGCSGYPGCRACYTDIDGKPDYNPSSGSKAKRTGREVARPAN